MTRPLAVLHAHSGNVFGGIETILVELARRPAALHHSFALSYEGRLAGLLRGTGSAVETLGEVRFSRPWTVLRARRTLARIIAAQPPDVVVCHSPWALAAFGVVARQHRRPLVLWVHSAFTGRHWVERLARLSVTPDLGICACEYARAALPRVFPSIPSVVLYAPVSPPPSFDPARRPSKRQGHGATPESVVVTIAARLEAWKGHAQLLEALASLRDVPTWTAWVVGGAQRRAEDVYRAALERQVNEARIAERVHFLGQRDDVASLLWASDVYCQPNAAPDIFPMSFIEALYAGLPVVTTDWGGAQEIVTADCGLLVPPHDPNALRNALQRMVSDAALRERMRQGAPARAAFLCDPDKSTARLQEILGGVARPGGSLP